MNRRWFGWFRRKPESPPQWVEGHTGTLVMETDEGKLYKIVGIDDTCPDCGGKGFWAGPSGGMSQNIFCMNVDCRSGFNVTPFASGQGTCERISKGDIARYPNVPLRKFKVVGKVFREDDNGTELLASGEITKEGKSAEAIKEAWERDMRAAFPMGPDYNVEYHCTVTPLDETRNPTEGF